jgi:hypothetical protein
MKLHLITVKPFHAMYVDALEYHCPPDPKADLKMLGDEFAKFIDTDLEEEIVARLPAQQQLPARRSTGSAPICNSCCSCRC